jgi:orotidine-5'-phosphate decarboxylase
VKENPIIVALDASDPTDMDHLIGELSPHVGKFKIGLEAVTSMDIGRATYMLSPETDRARVMLDLKLHDIPNTMVKAMEAAAQKWAVWGVTVHASAGPKALAEVAKVAKDNALKCIVVTVLTSHSYDEAGHIFNSRLPDILQRFVRDADEAGCDAIVCAPTDAASIRMNLDEPDKMTLICPGVRPEWAQKNDQARVLTPVEAIDAGADYLVIGRPITKPPNNWSRAAAAKRILMELTDAA